MKALYYPYATPGNRATFARALLYYDEVGFINPYHTFAAPPSRGESWKKLPKAIEEEWHSPPSDHVFFVSPLELLGKYEKVLVKNMIDDLSDEKFLRLASGLNQNSWILASVKIPRHEDAQLRRLMVNLPYAMGSLLPDEPTMTEGPFENYAESLRHELYKREWGALGRLDAKYRELRMVRVPFVYGESLMLNHSICACVEKGCVPFTDSEIHSSFFRLKAERLLRSQSMRQFLLSNGLLDDIRAARIADLLLAKELPDLSGLPFSTIDEIQRELRTELGRFRREIDKVSRRIQAELWSEQFEQEVRDLVASDLSPRTQELADDLNQLAVDKIAGAGMKILASLSVSVTVFTGVPLPVLLLGASGIITLTDWLDYWRKRAKKLRNGLSFVLKAGRSVNSARRNGTDSV